MSEALELVEKIRSHPANTWALEPTEAATLIRAYRDRLAVHAHFAAIRLARWRDLCLDKIDKLESDFDFQSADLFSVQIDIDDARARIAELEAQLATVKDDCADRAVEWLNDWELDCTDDSLRAAIKGE